MGRVVHASKSGWFPFCIEQIDPVYPALYSTVSLEAAMKIYWRIRKIRFYGTYTQFNNGNPAIVPWEFVAERNAASEEDLVCNPIPAWNTASIQNLLSAQFSFEEIPVAYQNPGSSQLVLLAEVRAELINVLQEEAISFTSVPLGPGSQSFSFEGVLFTNQPPEFILPGSIGYEVLEYWSYGGTYHTATGLPL